MNFKNYVPSKPIYKKPKRGLDQDVLTITSLVYITGLTTRFTMFQLIVLYSSIAKEYIENFRGGVAPRVRAWLNDQLLKEEKRIKK